MLDEAREAGRERGVEYARVHPCGEALDDLSTATRPVAARPIGVLGSEPAQGSGSMQEVVDQGVDGARRSKGRGELSPDPQR